MAAKPEKTKFFKYYVLNIKLRKQKNTSDPTPDEYVELFEKLQKKRIHEESSASKHCIFRFMFEEKEKDVVEFLSGTFAQFTFIENSRWFNLESLDLDEEFKVPDGLFPDAKIIDFIFVPKAHRFCYRIYNSFSCSPYSIKSFLEKAFDKVTKSGEYVEVDVESDTSAIDEIMSAREIRKLTIDVSYSNLDTGSDLKKFVEEDIKASNTRRIKIEATHKPNVSINIKQSKILTGAIESSISNGDTEAVILDENNKVKKIKTSQYPKIIPVQSTESRANRSVFEKIMQLFRPDGH